MAKETLTIKAFVARMEEEAVAKLKTLKQIAQHVNANGKLYDLRAEVSRGYASTDTKIKGTRLIRPGKGRTGARIKFFSISTKRRDAIGGEIPVFDHNNAETYRQVDEVRRWLGNWLGKRR